MVEVAVGSFRVSHVTLSGSAICSGAVPPWNGRLGT